ncbi:MAG: hypothetical protein J7L07_08185 [Candidatus Odinarchaeota archaeon]|nr:hypothetical protein [Candidatus Odinarchaeota archaeon]
MKHQKYFKCLDCENLQIKKRNKKFEFFCTVFDVRLEAILKNYEDYANCSFYIPKNHDGGDVLQPSIIFIGKKEISRYILATLKALETSSRCVLKARGRLISRAVDVAVNIKNKLLPGTVVKKVRIGTAIRDDGKRVSEIEILLAWGGFRGNVG